MTEQVPLREVVRQLGTLSRELNTLDDDISLKLRQIEETIRQRRSTGGPVGVLFPPWGKLAWSGRRGRWRLVVIDEDECEDLMNMPALCRSDACFVLPKLVERMELR